MPKKPYYFRKKWAKLQTITQKYSKADFMREIWYPYRRAGIYGIGDERGMEAEGACSDMEGPMGSPLQSLSAPEIVMLQWLLSVLVGEEGQGLGNQENREWERNGKGGSRNGRSEKMGSRRNRVELCNDA